MAQAIHEERCMRCERMHGVVDGKLNHRQNFAPICERLDVPAENFFEDAVEAFHLTISLLMVGSRHSQTCSDRSEHGLSKLRREPWNSVRD